MKSYIDSPHIYRFRADQRGSFTLESTFVFPIVLICTFIVVFFSLLVYERAELYHAAWETAERAAFVWSDSHKDPINGAFAVGVSDGLYWRVSGDRLADLLPFGSDGTPTEVSVPDPDAGNHSGLPERKLSRSAEPISPGITGYLNYTNRLFERVVGASFGRAVSIPRFLREWIGDGSTAAQGRSYVVEPVEFIRTVDVTRSFISQLKAGFSKTSAEEVQKAAESKVNEKINISSEAQAKAYLQKLLNSTGKTVTTSYGIRKIDVLDQDGIMHEAKMNVDEELAREEIRKDLELVQKGEVKGVVWHFFRVGRTGKIDLSANLKRELERSGIVVIIHN